MIQSDSAHFPLISQVPGSRTVSATVAGAGSAVDAEEINPLADNHWDTLVMARPGHSVFHRAAWARVLAETYQHRPFYQRITIAGNEVALVPLMEVDSPFTGRRGVSLPFADFAGPIWSDPSRSAAVYQNLRELAAFRKWKHLEIRGDSSPAAGVPVFRSYRAHELDLSPGIESIAKRLHASTRRSIQKAERSGLVISIERGADALRAFYDLHSHTRRRHGLPPQPFRFFESIGQHLLTPGLGEIVLARHNRTPVAGAVFFHSGGRAIYKFGASNTDCWDLRPNHLVMWSAIRHLADSGCHSLHFGRTAVADAGLNRFKQSWAAADGSLDYFRHHAARDTWVTEATAPTESHHFIFGRLPIPVNRLAGRLIYPHLD